MDVRYRQFDPDEASRRELLERLFDIYKQLLLHTSGDADEALDWLDRLSRRHVLYGGCKVDIEQFKSWLEERREARRTAEGGMQMTRKGERTLRQDSLDRVFGSLARDDAGDHRVAEAGAGTERMPETRPWQFGDSLSLLDAAGSVRNALRRGIDDLTLVEEDLEVHETEHHSSCATVLLIDISHSMILYGEDRITPAKRVALALTELIRTRYPKDSLHVVTFGDEAREVPLEELAYLEVGPFHTNTRDGLRVAQDLLRKKKQANRQILMITDGKPSALTERDGTIYKNPFGLDRRVVARTLDEAVSCRRRGIPITTFMLTDDPTLVGFIEEFTQANQGRAYYSRPDRLGSFLFVDYIRNRRRSVH